MELKEFVSETLTQIISGVKDAQSQQNELGAKINPTIGSAQVSASSIPTSYIPTSNISSGIFFIEFDVSVFASNEKGVKGGGSLNVAAIKVGADGEKSSSNAQQNKINFVVPITLPVVND
ncbi:MAG: hypothetical protein K9J16_08220 [Melioribacteraceae bacterium]|nr:hypothetical protein [Melioribacteraceae bacterium]MCF8353888.1 hypothetical protein [Melioribacteraceae bacterium]MCF8393121.1 hypothetical protein [Melioribacteraceae bacterium]MCF8419240.1 hypothetical protein [Melioribacteraceae bacterium]